VNFRRIPGVFLRVFLKVFVITLAFTVDIKVKADVLFDIVQGKVEVEKEGSLVSVVDKMKMQEPFDVETFSRSIVKFKINSIYIGVAEKSLISCPQAPRLDISWGNVFVSAPTKEREWLTLRTPQAELSSSGAEFIVTVRGGKTTVYMVSGKLQMKDRASGEIQMLRPGYSDWIAGQAANGSHVKGSPEAISFEWVMAELHVLGNFTMPETQSRYDRLRPLAQQAVDEVSQQNHDQIVGDMQLLRDIQENDLKRETLLKKEQASLKKMFRDKSLGDPDGNIEVPWESSRSPANSAE